MTECAERATTEAYAAGKLTSANAARAHAHIHSCTTCKVAFERIATAATVAAGRRDLAATPSSTPPAVAPTVPPTVPPTLTAHGTPPPPTELAEARATIGRYRVIAKLGAGGMGVVYSAEDPELDRQVAIKLPSRSRTRSHRTTRGCTSTWELRRRSSSTRSRGRSRS